MIEQSALLTALQYGDNFFPSGSVAFSWGLEALCADKITRDAPDVARFIEGQLRHRWAKTDRVFIAAAYEAGSNLKKVAQADRTLEAMSLAFEFREGSKRAGKALLNVHEKIGTAMAGAYRALISEGQAYGHLAIIQGLTLHHVGLDLTAALTVIAHTTCVGFIGAALRLGRIGHLDGQRILTNLHSLIGEIVAGPVPGVREAAAYAPQTEIAAMRHETQATRLFSN